MCEDHQAPEIRSRPVSGSPVPAFENLPISQSPHICLVCHKRTFSSTLRSCAANSNHAKARFPDVPCHSPATFHVESLIVRVWKCTSSRFQRSVDPATFPSDHRGCQCLSKRQTQKQTQRQHTTTPE